jgi:5-methylcytosine-specific restriction endonuclease McrA
MPVDTERLASIKKMIACSVDTADEITEVLVLLARTPHAEWEKIILNGKNHRKVLTTGVCFLCALEYKTSRNTNTEICDTCYSNHITEVYRVHTQCYRAKQAGLLATLSLTEWLSTVAHFQYLCAYCRVQKYEALDHFIPLNLGGGTTKENCIPACEACNRKKNHMHPDKVKSIAKEDIERIREFLSTLKIAS